MGSLKGRRRVALEGLLFRATGRAEDLPDLHDNLRAELDRLATLAELASCAGGRFDPDRLAGLGALIGDGVERMGEILHRAASWTGRRGTIGPGGPGPSGTGRGATRRRARASGDPSGGRG